jgi:Family of unknown function (DUF6503)
MRGKIYSVLTALLITVLYTSIVSAEELEQSIDAHGGLETFREYGTLEYDQEFDLTGVMNLKSHQLIDLNSRKVLITSDTYKIGFDGQEAWIEPNMEALGIPPRFYASTPFYFFGLPFLFADPGVNTESLGTKELDGKEYNVVKFTFDKGVGDTPDDDYVAYFDKETDQLTVLNYIVTYPPLMQGKSIEELERHAGVYEEWQKVGGLLVPKKISFYEWTDGNLGEEPHGAMVFENVIFKKENPEASIFSKPQGAQVDNSHMPQ